ncbi:uncharacterized protein B0P05DRAFT_125640 [Gilbertella persicaria]|uniref:uncharacterized protein n=1 Tax=Gilbertella persicaria TaxID=101096 RepID=UPI00221F8657|nr:uncharacterized protein B0P05DRAFT_125640 [Gilbertella persicaria]KAI8077276.1 hypothetical protein B0P05DRAFT_125640 [Gilbertella persicaria]
MNYNCIICFGSLLSDTSNSAVIPCGHVFHKNCIRPWIDQSKKCPLCKKSTSHRQIISPLYFSTTEDTEVVDDPSSSNTKTRDLQLKINTLTNEYNSCNKDRQSLRKDLANANLKIEQMQHELKSTTKAMRYLKQVRRVADIDDYLASPTAKAYLRSLQNMSNDDLLVAFGSLTARFTASNK